MTAGLEGPSKLGGIRNSIAALGRGTPARVARGLLNARWAATMNKNICHLGAGNQGARDQ